MAAATPTNSAVKPLVLIDRYPHYFLLVSIAVIGLIWIPFPTWVTLTVAGLTMGLMIFVMASGMTLSFGLMGVLNLGHGALITIGAFIGASVVTGLGAGHWALPALARLRWAPSSAALWNVGALSVILAVLSVTGFSGLRALERFGFAAGSARRRWLALLSSALATAVLFLSLSGWARTAGITGQVLTVMVCLAAAITAGRVSARRRVNAARGAERAPGALLGLWGGAVALVCAEVLANWPWTHEFVTNLGVVVPAFLVAFIVTGLVGYIFERLIIRPVYGDHLKQILVTMGAAIVIGELLKVFWGPDQVPMTRPASLEGGLSWGGITVEKYRLLAMVIGLGIYWSLNRIINRTKVGLLIRAGVENLEMVEAHGYRIRLLFIAVFMAGAALAGAGGVLWGLYQSYVSVALGNELLVLIIIVIIIGGMGSVTGCFYGALLVGLLDNYTTYLVPKVALFSSIGLMVLILMWRPQGLRPGAGR